ncbi:glutaminase A [Kordiimonas aestuarii]|uniref:glutaminase A n=1 Tax=Kordiimonas aestuarii TaxID=1005925 RepID=UPI0021D3B609|nr:glutaminase A [Kordiimonas aestuarii]
MASSVKNTAKKTAPKRTANQKKRSPHVKANAANDATAPFLSSTAAEEITKIFRALDRSRDGFIPRDGLLAAFNSKGIHTDDPRVKDTLEALKRSHEAIDLESFTKLFGHDIGFLNRIAKDQFIVPRFNEFCDEMSTMFEDCREIRDGAVADYIPQLARVAPDQFGMGVCTIDGQRASFGDKDVPFCVQSTCKPINYAMALTLNGEEKVHAHVGREPSGRSFNELALNDRGLPHNPMINAGAIMSCSLIHPDLPLSDRFDHVIKTWTALSGGAAPGYNNPVYLSEKATADRNFALAYFMQEKKAFPAHTDLLQTLDFYFQSCSIETTAERMSIAAATLANAGVNPLTNERVFSSETVKHCLSLMYSCGMYDFSGEFAFTIGLPAKSGVSGALMVVVPNRMGFAIWSPRLDKLGNSVRGIEFCRKLVERYSFHNYDGLSEGEAKKDPIRSQELYRSDLTYQLIHAASLGDLAEITRLVAHGADINAADYDGRSPLHLAAAEGRELAVAYLLARGANPQAKDRWGATPVEDANRHNHSEIEQRLKKSAAA